MAQRAEQKRRRPLREVSTYTTPAAGAVAAADAGGILTHRVRETGRGVGREPLHQRVLLVGVVQVRGAAVVLGDVRLGGRRGQQLVDHPHLKLEAGLSEHRAEAAGPAHQRGGLPGGGLGQRPVVVRAEDRGHVVGGGGGPGVDQVGGDLRGHSPVRVELH